MKNFFKNKVVFTLLCVLGFIILLAAVIFAVIFAGKCIVDSEKVRSTPIATAEPTPTPIPDRNYDEGTVINFEPDLSKLELGTLDEQTLLDYSKEHWLDITPAEIKSGIDCVIMKHDSDKSTYLYYNGEYLRLDEGTDGYGVVDMILCDLDADESRELVYSYSFGTGDEYASRVGWYDFDDGKLDVAEFSLLGKEMILSTEDGMSCRVSRAERKMGENEGGYLLHMLDDKPFGVVVEIEGKLLLKLDA